MLPKMVAEIEGLVSKNMKPSRDRGYRRDRSHSTAERDRESASTRVRAVDLFASWVWPRKLQRKEGSRQRTIGSRTARLRVAARAESRIRRFPSVLQPADVSVLSFEISGQLKAVNLQVGQKVQLGDVLAEIDPRSLQAKSTRQAPASSKSKHRSRTPKETSNASKSF